MKLNTRKINGKKTKKHKKIVKKTRKLNRKHSKKILGGEDNDVIFGKYEEKVFSIKKKYIGQYKIDEKNNKIKHGIGREDIIHDLVHKYYIGNFVDGKKSGFGILVEKEMYKSNKKNIKDDYFYICNFVNDKKSGFGIEIGRVVEHYIDNITGETDKDKNILSFNDFNNNKQLKDVQFEKNIDKIIYYNITTNNPIVDNEKSIDNEKNFHVNQSMKNIIDEKINFFIKDSKTKIEKLKENMKNLENNTSTKFYQINEENLLDKAEKYIKIIEEQVQKPITQPKTI